MVTLSWNIVTQSRHFAPPCDNIKPFKPHLQVCFIEKNAKKSFIFDKVFYGKPLKCTKKRPPFCGLSLYCGGLSRATLYIALPGFSRIFGVKKIPSTSSPLSHHYVILSPLSATGTVNRIIFRFIFLLSLPPVAPKQNHRYPFPPLHSPGHFHHFHFFLFFQIYLNSLL